MIEQQPQVLPFVSVVVIVLNGADTIGACLDSLMAQSYPKICYEVVVVDNGSSDGTVDIVKKYPVKLINEPTRGYAPARNAGVRAAQGEIIAYTDADCVAESDWMASLVRPYSDPSVGLVGGKVRAFPSAEPTRVERFIDDAGFVGPPKQTINGIIPYITTQNASYRRIFLEKADMFDTSLPCCEDVDLARRIQLILGAKAVLVPEAIVYHRNHADLPGLLRFRYRDGYGEILMATRWKNYSVFRTDVGRQLKYLFRQLISLAIYTRSFVYRSILFFMKRKKFSDVTYPLLWLCAEGATIVGKIKGLIATKMLRYDSLE